MAVAHEAFLVAKRPGQRLAEHDAGVLDGVVKIDLHVALGAHVEVEERVLGEKREHVVEERNAGSRSRFAGSVHDEPDGDVGLAGDADDLRGACLVHG